MLMLIAVLALSILLIVVVSTLLYLRVEARRQQSLNRRINNIQVRRLQ